MVSGFFIFMSQEKNRPQLISLSAPSISKIKSSPYADAGVW